jgi:hypothetical protein
MYQFIDNAKKMFQKIENDDPTIKSFKCYVFDLSETRMLYNAMCKNTHVTYCDINIQDNAKDYNPMMKYKLAILTIVRNNLLQELDEARTEAIHLHDEINDRNFEVQEEHKRGIYEHNYPAR